MESTYQGDLADVVRASGGAIGSNTSPEAPVLKSDWLFPSIPDDFGDPFSMMGDPLLHDIDIPPVPVSCFSDTGNTEGLTGGGCSGGDGGKRNILDDNRKRHSNSISRMQMSPNSKFFLSPCDSLMGLEAEAPLLVSHDHSIFQNSLESYLVESPTLQISSPRNTGIKPRKSQAKKVVCIPAPAPANSRTRGENVPSDLWAWRKYGQKPIKGSPYPRGYYRCSSSKGCSARKQVERCRTDTNKLVITYTFEHNHPWPTQRNALAGSTRSQPSKNSSSAPKNSSSSDNQTQRSTNSDEMISAENVSSPPVKEETDQEYCNKKVEMTDDVELSEGFQQIYKPALSTDDCNHGEDFFAELGEIGADSLDLLFIGGEEGEEQKASNPLSFFN